MKLFSVSEGNHSFVGGLLVSLAKFLDWSFELRYSAFPIRFSYFWCFMLIVSTIIIIVSFVLPIPLSSTCPDDCIDTNCFSNAVHSKPCECTRNSSITTGSDNVYCEQYLSDTNSSEYQLYRVGFPIALIFALLSSICLCQGKVSEYRLR